MNDQDKVNWLRNKKPLIVQLRQFPCYLIHQKIRGPLSKISVGHSIINLITILILFAIASAPFWPQIMGETYNPSPWVLVIVMVLLLVASGILERVKRSLENRRRYGKNQTQLSTYQHRAFHSLMKDLNLDGEGAAERVNDHIGRILECVEYSVKLILGKSDRSYFSSSLLLFDDENGDTVKFVSRSNHSRNLEPVIKNSRDTVAYYAAKAETVCRVDDFKSQNVFPFVGFTDAEAPYRSIFFMPIIDVEGKRIKGVLTIDSALPYEFWGGIKAEVRIQVQPYITLLNCLLAGHENGVRIE